MGALSAAAPALAAILFGASTPFAKALLDDIDPWALAGFLSLGSGLGLAVVSAARHGLSTAPAAEAPLTRADLPWLAAVVLVGGAMGPRFSCSTCGRCRPRPPTCWSIVTRMCMMTIISTPMGKTTRPASPIPSAPAQTNDPPPFPIPRPSPPTLVQALDQMTMKGGS
jgi:hypothetical protein